MRSLRRLYQRLVVERAFQLSYSQVWLILGGVILLIVLLSSYDPTLPIVLLLVKWLSFGSATLVIGQLLWRVSINYANYIAQQHFDASDAAQLDTPEPDPHALIDMRELLPPRLPSSPGRKQMMVTLPGSTELVHVGDPRFQALMGEAAQASTARGGVATFCKAHGIPYSTFKYWRVLYRQYQEAQSAIRSPTNDHSD